MPDNLDKYVPEFDEANIRARLTPYSKEELIEMLIRSYKEKRVIAGMLDDTAAAMNRLHIVP